MLLEAAWPETERLAASGVGVLAMAERDRKRLRPALQRRNHEATHALQAMLNGGNVTVTSLAKILKDVKKLGDQAFSAAAIYEANLANFAHLRCVDTFPLKSGGTFDLEYAEPSLLLGELIQESVHLVHLYSQAAEANVSGEPFRLIVAFDEYTPGSKFKGDNRRKVMVCLFSFTNLGQPALSQDVSWTTPLVIRHCMLAKIDGGWAHVLRVFLRRLLFGRHGLASAGLPLTLDNGDFLLRARLSNILSDGEGLKYALDWKGQSGLKPCVKHHNVFKKNSGLAHRRPGYVDICCFDQSQFKQWSSADAADCMRTLIEGCNRVASGEWTKTRYEQLTQMVGMNANPSSLLCDPDLMAHTEIIGCATYDWCHTMLQDGAFTNEVWLLLSAAHIDSHDIHVFLRDPAWCFPASTSSKCKALHQVFDCYRSSSSEKADKLKANASEVLSLYVLLRHFLETYSSPLPHAEYQSFAAACKILDLLMLAKRGVAVAAETAAEMQSVVASFLQAHLTAYGNEHVKPKHHWLQDIPAQLHRDQMVLDAFIVERGHLKVKTVAENIDNTSSFEASVTAGIINTQIKRARDAKGLSALHGPTKQLGSATLAHQMTHLTLQISVGDIVFNGDMSGEVVACAIEDGMHMVVVDTFCFVRHSSQHSSTWRRSGGTEALWIHESPRCAMLLSLELHGTWHRLLHTHTHRH